MGMFVGMKAELSRLEGIWESDQGRAVVMKGRRRDRASEDRMDQAEIMDVACRAGVPEEQLAVSSRMKLDEIRSTCLIYDGIDITGNEYDSMQQRHTKFYRLDVEYIRSFGDGD